MPGSTPSRNPAPGGSGANAARTRGRPCLASFSCSAFWEPSSSSTPLRQEARTGARKSARVQVVKGDTLSDVAAKLEEAGVIKSAFVFELQARYEGYGTEIKTGRYTFEPGQDSGEILHKLTVGQAAAHDHRYDPRGSHYRGDRRDRRRGQQCNRARVRGGRA